MPTSAEAIREILRKEARAFAKKRGFAGAGEVEAALDGFDAYMRGERVASEWLQSYGQTVKKLMGGR